MARDYRYEYNFKDAAVTGDTWKGATCTLTVNGSAPVSAITAVETTFQFKKGGVTFTLSTASAAQMSILDAASGIYRYNSQILDWPAGLYEYTSKFTFANGAVKTYAYGILVVKETNE